MPETQPNGRAFPWICPKCRKNEVRPATIPYHTERLHQGKLISVDIPNLNVPQCSHCGELVFNYSADEQILAAVKAKQVGQVEIPQEAFLAVLESNQ